MNNDDSSKVPPAGDAEEAPPSMGRQPPSGSNGSSGAAGVSADGRSTEERIREMKETSDHTAKLSMEVAEHAAKLRMQEAEHAATLQEAAEKRRREEDEAVQQRRAERVFQNKVRLMEAATENSLKKRKREDDMTNENELTKKIDEERAKIVLAREQEEIAKAAQAAKDKAAYYIYTRDLKNSIRHRVDSHSPSFRFRPFTAGYLKEYLTYKQVSPSSADDEICEQATLCNMGNLMPADYTVDLQKDDVRTMEGFYAFGYDSTGVRKKIILEGYMAILRILADPLVPFPI